MQRLGSSLPRGAVVALACASACGRGGEGATPVGTGSATASVPALAGSAPGAAAPRAPGDGLTAHVAVERLRDRLVAKALEASDVEVRVAAALRALAALPGGDARELAILEGVDATLRAPPRARPFRFASLAVAAASRWLARGEPRRARAVLAPPGDLHEGLRSDEQELLVAVLLRLDGRAAAIARGASPDDPAGPIAVARAEARWGDFRWATELARHTSSQEACLVWNVLVLRHVRDAREPDATDAWANARAQAELGPRPDHVHLTCAIDLARVAVAVGAGDEASRVLRAIPIASVWPACRVLDALSSDFDPMRLDVVVDVVAQRRDHQEEPAPRCLYDASVAATGSGRLALGRSLFARGSQRAAGFSYFLGDPRAHVARVALGDVEPFAEIEPARLAPEDVAALVHVLEDDPARRVDGALLDAAFPAP